jgi:hypothetical protein
MEKGDMNRELLLLVDALRLNVAKKSRSPRWNRARLGDEEAFHRRVDARVDQPETGDYDSFRRWTVVPDEDHEARADRDHGRRRARPGVEARRRHRGRSSPSSSGASVRRRRSR